MPPLSLNLDTPDLARHYEEASSERQFKAGKLLVAKLGLKSGEDVLDVGSGTGLLAEYVAGIVGPGGAVVAIDPLPLRIEIAKNKAKPNLTFRVGDTYALGSYADASFDVVYLNAVFHWLPEKLGPLRQWRRVLKPGGRLGIVTGSKDHLSTVQIIRKSVLAREPYARFPEARAALAYRVSAGELEALLVEAGFTVRSIEVVPSLAFYDSGDAAIEFSQASSFGNFLGHLPADLCHSAKEDIRRELDALRTPEGIQVSGARIFAIAEVTKNIVE